ncbi:VWA domain-containing protein [Gracilibacillus xinjiangensis]|uniref:VWA domain-containing protein n=1 Tax=Gracilibacillus xinjiangensis TaxID=1193282 RepID=A0ABV8WTA9_9BACI
MVSTDCSRKHILIGMLIALFIILTGCTNDDIETEQPNEENSNKKNEETREVITDPENNKEIDIEHESAGEMGSESKDPLEDLLDQAPEEPTNLEEIIAYPEGPLAGNGALTGEEPLMEETEMAAYVKDILPSIEEEKDEAYLDQWWRAYRYLFAEEYPDPRYILKEINYNHFGSTALEDERFHFKDQINVLLILDVSQSMAHEVDGKTMLEIAKNSILDFGSDLPEDANIGVRVYGHEGSSTGKSREESCQASDIIYGFQPASTSDIEQVIGSLSPTGWTPIGFSLEQAKKDFAPYPGENNTNLIYIVSDGAETCDGDPAVVAKDLAESDIQSIINVIGFNVGLEGQNQLREIAEAGGGMYTNAGDEEELKEALGQGDALIQRWKDWKEGERFNVREQKDEQALEAIWERNQWTYLISDELHSQNSVLHELFQEDYINRSAYDFMKDRHYEQRDLYSDVKETTYEELQNEIEDKYKAQLEKINEAYAELYEEEE